MNVQNNIMLLVLLLIIETLSLCHANDNEAVGVVSLVIGDAYALTQAGTRRVLEKDSAIFVGDRVETNERSHVHIKFIDHAHISVRPQSQLKIESYDYNGTHPEKSSIRFFLYHGVIRSISGKATEADHSRYRLNTPIAALGVLGTDYVVRVTAEQTLAAVFSGGIALAPLNALCQSTGLGVCTNATTLMAEMTGQYLELNKGDISSQLKVQTLDIKPKLNITSEKKISGQDIKVNNVEISSKANETITTNNNNTTINIVVENEKTKILPEIVTKYQLSSLFWVRWPWQAQHVADVLSQNKSTVASDASITVGNGYAGLFREASDLTELQPQQGIYQFKLQQSHVVFTAAGQSWNNSTAAQINQAQLAIDFNQRRFNTHLDISHAQIGQTRLDVSGNIDNDGLFRAKNIDSKVSGALSLEGNAAGMQFEKQVEQGLFQGIGIWTR